MDKGNLFLRRHEKRRRRHLLLRTSHRFRTGPISDLNIQWSPYNMHALLLPILPNLECIGDGVTSIDLESRL